MHDTFHWNKYSFELQSIFWGVKWQCDVQNGLAKLSARDLDPHLSEEVFSFAVILK